MRFLNARGWLAATALALFIVACAVGAALPAPAPAGATLDHPWSRLP